MQLWIGYETSLKPGSNALGRQMCLAWNHRPLNSALSMRRSVQAVDAVERLRENLYEEQVLLVQTMCATHQMILTPQQVCGPCSILAFVIGALRLLLPEDEMSSRNLIEIGPARHQS